MDDLESFFCLLFFADEIWNILWRVDLYGASVLFISSAGDGTHSDQSDKKSIYNHNVMNTLISDKWDVGPIPHKGMFYSESAGKK